MGSGVHTTSGSEECRHRLWASQCAVDCPSSLEVAQVARGARSGFCGQGGPGLTREAPADQGGPGQPIRTQMCISGGGCLQAGAAQSMDTSSSLPGRCRKWGPSCPLMSVQLQKVLQGRAQGHHSWNQDVKSQPASAAGAAGMGVGSSSSVPPQAAAAPAGAHAKQLQLKLPSRWLRTCSQRGGGRSCWSVAALAACCL